MSDVPVIAQEPIGDPANTPQAYAVDATEAQLMTGLGDFLKLVTGMEVTQGQQNRVPEPKPDRFITMTSAARVQLSSTIRTNDPDTNHIAVRRSTRCDMQINVYGRDATDKAQIITTLLRDDFGYQFLDPYGVTPLYCDDGRQMPLVNGEFQYQQRWLILASLQVNPSVSTPAQFADSVTPVLVEVA